MQKNSLKNIIARTVFSIFLIFLPATVSSADEKDVQKFVEKVADTIISVVKNHSTSEQKQADQLLEVINSNFDTVWMGKFVLGRDYRDLSDSQKNEYAKLYNHYLRNTYFPILIKYNNESYSVTKVIKTGTNQYSASVRIIKQGRSPIDLDYTVRNDEGKYKLLDMSIEGVSTIFTQRSEFSSVLKQDGVDALFKKLARTEINVS